MSARFILIDTTTGQSVPIDPATLLTNLFNHKAEPKPAPKATEPRCHHSKRKRFKRSKEVKTAIKKALATGTKNSIELAQVTGFTTSTIRWFLNQLVNSGQVKVNGNKMNRTYELRPRRSDARPG